MTDLRTPDVYIEEIPSFPPSVVEVGTAIPAFIGYTERHERNGESVAGIPVKIRSFKDYERFYGGPNRPVLEVKLTYSSGSFSSTVKHLNLNYFLWFAVKLYFDNGGAVCFIVAGGQYALQPDAKPQKAALLAALKALQLEDEPTLLVIPDAARLSAADYKEVTEKTLKQCGTLKDRFAVLDVQGGENPLDDSTNLQKPSEIRKNVGADNLAYGAIYYPFLCTTISYLDLYGVSDETQKLVKVVVKVDDATAAAATTTTTTLDRLDQGGPKENENTAQHDAVREALRKVFYVVPPSGAVTGAYARTDATRGVWKAPANVGLLSVIKPEVKVDSAGQAGLNVDPTTGKSINVIRSFTGQGVLVWGARTLLGNSREWRYVPVRRFFNTVEESVKKATHWAVFEPNDARTWVRVRGMIESYLIEKWREGALAGAIPKEAFYVKCGLGTTMTSDEILDGKLNVEIGLAVVRPAEFIVLKFTHLSQKS